MNLQDLSPLVKKYWLPLILGGLSLIFFAYGLIGFLGQKGASEEVVFESATDSSATSSAQIMVDVAGSVLKPGVYRLSADSRVHDALVVAGGLSESADREWVAKNLNLALKLKDGVKIYIPSQGQSVELKAKSVLGTDSVQGLININIASEGELDSLPGIGPVTAAKIINGRPYEAIEDLLSRKIVGTKVFEQIREKITVY